MYLEDDALLDVTSGLVELMVQDILGRAGARAAVHLRHSSSQKG
jgi:hypothetical protein